MLLADAPVVERCEIGEGLPEVRPSPGDDTATLRLGWLPTAPLEPVSILVPEDRDSRTFRFPADGGPGLPRVEAGADGVGTPDACPEAVA